MEHGQEPGESIAEMLSSIAAALREAGDKLDTVAARVDGARVGGPQTETHDGGARLGRREPGASAALGVEERLAKLEAWAFTVANDISGLETRLDRVESDDKSEHGETSNSRHSSIIESKDSPETGSEPAAAERSSFTGSASLPRRAALTDLSGAHTNGARRNGSAFTDSGFGNGSFTGGSGTEAHFANGVAHTDDATSGEPEAEVLDVVTELAPTNSETDPTNSRGPRESTEFGNDIAEPTTNGYHNSDSIPRLPQRNGFGYHGTTSNHEAPPHEPVPTPVDGIPLEREPNEPSPEQSAAPTTAFTAAREPITGSNRAAREANSGHLPAREPMGSGSNPQVPQPSFPASEPQTAPYTNFSNSDSAPYEGMIARTSSEAHTGENGFGLTGTRHESGYGTGEQERQAQPDSAYGDNSHVDKLQAMLDELKKNASGSMSSGSRSDIFGPPAGDGNAIGYQNEDYRLSTPPTIS